MKVWLDIFSGDEMVSDSYPFTESFDGACLEVKSKLLTKNANDDFGIGGEDSGAFTSPDASASLPSAD